MLRKSRFIEVTKNAPKKSIAKYIEQIRGVTYKPNDILDKVSSDSVVLYRANNILDNELINKDIIYLSSKQIRDEQLLKKNDIVMSASSGSLKAVGKIAFVNNVFSLCSFCAFCRVIRASSSISPRFIFEFLSSDSAQKELKKGLNGTNILNIKNSDIDNLKIPVLKSSIELEYIEFCYQIDKLKFIIQQKIEKLEQLKKSRFIEMFGDVKTNPFNWSVKELGTIAVLGSSKRVFVKDLKTHGIPFYRGTEIGQLAEGKDIVPELFITQQHYDELVKASGKPCIGDLLLPSICPDGRIWLVDTTEPFYFKDGRVLWIHSISKEFHSSFVLYFLKEKFQEDYYSIASGTTFAELKLFSLKSCTIFSVPLNMQKEYSEFAQHIDKLKLIAQKQLDFLVGQETNK